MVEAELFWANVPIGDDCWEWHKAISPNGYGKFSIVIDGRTTSTGAHRVAYQIEKGPIPLGLVIDHLCRNKKCIRPSHLEAVTNRVNTVDRAIGGVAALNSAKVYCPKGHELSGDNLCAYGVRRGRRICRTCKSTRAREFYRNNKERFAVWKRRHPND